jgi:ABC-type lipoprotein export system ATPase subunit/histone H3/H4
MKVSELYIKKYHQFEDFTLNLTYPEGHPKAGKPLDKVCFIGQSGTGKTTLINLLRRTITVVIIEGYSNHFLSPFIIPRFRFTEFKDLENNNLTLRFTDIKLSTTKDELGDLLLPIMIAPGKIPNQKSFIFQNDNVKLFHFPCDINLPPKDEVIDKNLVDEDDKLSNYSIIDFAKFSVNQIWQTINEAIITYRESEIKKSLEIAQIAQRKNINTKDILKATDEFRKWREETPNPIQDLADNYLDKIIGRFNLKVKTELDFEKKEDIETIKIQQKNGKEIPFEALSTGTKQVILTALPLYGLKPKDSIILFDEPERSLYPDIQTEIVDFYTSMAENSQFFFATHSPLVAASFEPWEIIELKFNEETGNVEQELYYDTEKGRHVDNYTIYPQYLTYDGILKRVFDMKKEPNSLRMNELVKLATLESQLKHNELSPEAKKEKFEEIIKLADQLDWDLK